MANRLSVMLHSMRGLAKAQRKTMMAVLKEFRNASKATKNFAQQVGLSCEDGCGRCCQNPRMETTVLEMLPLAQMYWMNGRAQELWNHLSRSVVDGQCVFYQPDALQEGRGRCSVYSVRPIVCRLFGFSAQKDKFGQKKIQTCRVIKNAQAEQLKIADQKIILGLDVPVMSDFHFRMSQIDPSMGAKLLPINQAAREAIEYLGLHKQLRKTN